MKNQSAIDNLKAQVQALLPSGWQAGEFFNLSLSGKSSPVMVDARRIGYKDAKLAVPVELRKEWARQWSLETVAQAKEIYTTLKAAGLNVFQDAGDLVIKP